MKTKSLEKYLFGAIVLLLVIFAGWAAHSDQGGVTRIYKNANAPFDNKRVQSVIERSKDTVLVRTRYQGGFFWAETRKDKIERFKCSQCHNNKNVTVVKAAEIAHGDIGLNHGGQVKQGRHADNNL